MMHAALPDAEMASSKYLPTLQFATDQTSEEEMTVSFTIQQLSLQNYSADFPSSSRAHLSSKASSNSNFFT
jgi:hypothetical protein